MPRCLLPRAGGRSPESGGPCPSAPGMRRQPPCSWPDWMADRRMSATCSASGTGESLPTRGSAPGCRSRSSATAGTLSGKTAGCTPFTSGSTGRGGGPGIRPRWFILIGANSLLVLVVFLLGELLQPTWPGVPRSATQRSTSMAGTGPPAGHPPPDSGRYEPIDSGSCTDPRHRTTRGRRPCSRRGRGARSSCGSAADIAQ